VAVVLPRTVDARVRALSIATLVGNILIVATGGAVRLTGSGLGCPTWPQCTAESLIATPEMGIHGAIEFGNRLLTFLLVAIAILTFLSVVRMRRTRPDLFVLALVVGFAIPVQAVVGGITVLTNLNPFVVGLHFLASIVMVVIATVYTYRVYRGPRGGVRRVPRGFAILAQVTSFAVALTIVVGILTTGSGPHAGDGGAARNGLDPALMQHVHSWPAYAMLALTAVLAAWAVIGVGRVALPALVLLGLELVQVAVGVTQSRLGLPEVLVGTHMVLAACTAAATTWLILSLRAPAVDLRTMPAPPPALAGEVRD
jgi:cytochrome c oxidase assembly protein subunit 15